MTNQTAASLATASAIAPVENLSPSERQILRHLAGRVAELAARPLEHNKRELWYRHNSLQSTRPLIFCDPENGWNEIITENILECRGSLSRRWEIILRKEIFYGEKMKDDKPIEPYFDIGYTHEKIDWLDREIIHGGKEGGSYVWEAQIKNTEDLAKIKEPGIVVDYKTTLETFELACSVFKDLLTPKLKGLWWWKI